MSEDYIEAILVWNPRGPSDPVRRWWVDRGFAVQTMRTGLLISGPAKTFEAALNVDLDDARLPFRLPIPSEIADDVASITIPGRRQYH